MSKEWLTLREASELLGVHPSTLRRWSDEGKIPFTRTPGGHRRFHRQTLEAYLQRQEAELPSSSAPPAPPDTQPWSAAFDEHQRQHVRELGQRLLGLLLQYITRQNDDERFLQEGRTVGRSYGQTIGKVGLSLIETVEAFLFFRSQITSMALQMPSFPRPGDDVELQRLHGRIDRFLNEVLLGTIEGYESVSRK